MKTYKKITIVGISERSIEDAIENAINQASRSVKGMSWFEVVETRGAVKDDRVTEYQVTLNVGFKIIEDD